LVQPCRGAAPPELKPLDWKPLDRSCWMKAVSARRVEADWSTGQGLGDSPQARSLVSPKEAQKKAHRPHRGRGRISSPARIRACFGSGIEGVPPTIEGRPSNARPRNQSLPGLGVTPVIMPTIGRLPVSGPECSGQRQEAGSPDGRDVATDAEGLPGGRVGAVLVERAFVTLNWMWARDGIHRSPALSGQPASEPHRSRLQAVFDQAVRFRSSGLR